MDGLEFNLCLESQCIAFLTCLDKTCCSCLLIHVDVVQSKTVVNCDETIFSFGEEKH